MSRRADRFEREWERVVAGVPAVRILSDDALPSDVARDLGTALSVLTLAEQIPGPALEQSWAELRARLEDEVQVTEPGLLRRVLQPHDIRPRHALRTLVAAAACMAVIAAVSLRALPGSPLYVIRTSLEHLSLALSPNDGGIHAHMAEARAGDLLRVLHERSFEAAPALAREVVDERAAAIAEGTDVTRIDAVLSQVAGALALAPAPLAAELEDILGDILPPPPPEGWISVSQVLDPPATDDPPAAEPDPGFTTEGIYRASGTDGESGTDVGTGGDQPAEDPAPADGTSGNDEASAPDGSGDAAPPADGGDASDESPAPPDASDESGGSDSYEDPGAADQSDQDPGSADDSWSWDSGDPPAATAN